MRKLLLVAVLLPLAGSEDSGTSSVPVPPPNLCAYSIGPIVNGVNFSKNVPPCMTLGPDGWFFDFPPVDGVHTVTRVPTEPGRSALRASFEIRGDAAVQFRSVQSGTGQGEATLQVQRCGDNWSGIGGFEDFRFYSVPTHVALGLGAFALRAQFSPELWTNIVGQQSAVGLQATLTNLCSIGVVFGNAGEGATAHGVFVVDGAAKFILTDMALE